MGKDSYLSLFLMEIVVMVAHLVLILRLSAYKFITEFFVFLALFLFASFSFYGVARQKSWGYPITAVFFALSLANMAYLYFYSVSYVLVVIAVIGVVGFISSVNRIEKSKAKRGETKHHGGLRHSRSFNDKKSAIEKELGSMEEPLPEIIIEDLKPAAEKKKRADKIKKPKKRKK